jgi:hypothetical protein
VNTTIHSIHLFRHVEVAAEEAPGAAEGGAEADAWLGVPDLGGASATTQERKTAGPGSLKMFTAVVNATPTATLSNAHE